MRITKEQAIAKYKATPITEPTAFPFTDERLLGFVFDMYFNDGYKVFRGEVNGTMALFVHPKPEETN